MRFGQSLKRICAFTASFSTSQRGKPTVNYMGNRYILHGNYKNLEKKRWKCYRYYRGCKACVNSVGDIIVSTKNIHNHDLYCDAP